MKKAILGIISLILIVFSCNPKPTPEETSPQAPDFAALVPHFPSFFDTTTLKSSFCYTKFPESNFLLAHNYIDKWRRIFLKKYSTNFFILKNLKDLEFSYWGNNSWFAEKNITLDSEKFSVDVYANILSDGSIDWELYLSVNDAPKYIFLSGNNDSTAYEWTMFKHLLTGNFPILKIKSQENNDIKNKEFILIDSTSSIRGSSLKIISQQQLLGISVLSTLDSSHICIFTDTISRKGGIILEDILYCWDEQLENSDCDDIPDFCKDTTSILADTAE